MPSAEPAEPEARTLAIRRALETAKDHTAVADLLFFEKWHLAQSAHLAEMLRARQIRRANPQLSDEMESKKSPAISR